jgi:hypothetical protein
MAQIAIDFLRGAGWSSQAIEYFGLGAGGYSHCASVLSDGRYLDARNDVIAGIPAGVHIRLPVTEKSTRRLRATLEVSQEIYAEWEKNLRAKIGDAYGRGDILDFILGRPGHANGHYICSALAVNALQHVKVVPFPLPWAAHQITPNSVLVVVAAVGFSVGDLPTS